MSKKEEILTQEVLQELLDYNPETGELRWKERDRKWFKSDRAMNALNASIAGKPALDCTMANGYKCGSVLRHLMLAHRVIMCWYHGSYPPEVDHADGDRSNNRIENLESASSRTNSQNISLPSNNKSGTIGVSWDNRVGRWTARIRAQDKYHFLGNFHELDDAVAARKAAEDVFSFHPNHGKENRSYFNR